jgi:hypothetical protein
LSARGLNYRKSSKSGLFLTHETFPPYSRQGGPDLLFKAGNQFAVGVDQRLLGLDLLVVSPQFDDMKDRSGINLLWRIAARVDSRIEPVACGSRQWLDDDSSAIIEIARQQGELLLAA